MKITDRILLLPNTCIIMHLICVVVKLFQTKHEHIFLTKKYIFFTFDSILYPIYISTVNENWYSFSVGLSKKCWDYSWSQT